MLVAVFALSLACLISATPLKRSPELVVKLSSNKISTSSIEDISLTATVENAVICSLSCYLVSDLSSIRVMKTSRYLQLGQVGHSIHLFFYSTDHSL
jgi:hypothetical protein